MHLEFLTRTCFYWNTLKLNVDNNCQKYIVRKSCKYHYIFCCRNKNGRIKNWWYFKLFFIYRLQLYFAIFLKPFYLSKITYSSSRVRFAIVWRKKIQLHFPLLYVIFQGYFYQISSETDPLRGLEVIAYQSMCSQDHIQKWKYMQYVFRESTATSLAQGPYLMQSLAQNCSNFRAVRSPCYCELYLRNNNLMKWS